MSPLTREERVALADELKRIYIHCVETGFIPSSSFLKLERLLKAEDDELYRITLRSDVEAWLSAVEEEVSHTGAYTPKEAEFVEDMRSEFESNRGAKPLSNKQLKWLKALYDRI